MAKAKKNIKKESNITYYKENKYYNYLLFVTFAVFLMFFTTFKITGDDDVFWHLATGKYVVENHNVPSVDIFGYMTENDQWMPFEWGWDVITYAVYSFSGYTGLSVLRTVLLFAIFGVLTFILRKFKVNYTFIFIYLFIFAFAIIDRLTPRPHLMSYLFFALFVLIIVQYRYFNRESYKILFFLPLIVLLWSNMHMGIIAGMFLLVIYAGSEFLMTFYQKRNKPKEIRPLTKPEIVRLFLIIAACFMVMLVNPNGLETYIYAYEHTKMKLLETVNEWRSPFEASYRNSLVVMLFWLFLAGGISTVYYAFKKKDYFPFLLYIAFAVYSVRAIRFTVDYIIILFVFIVFTQYFWLENILSKKTREGIFNTPYLKVILAIIFVYLVFPIKSNSFYLETLRYYRITGFGINSDFIPVQMFEFMKANKIPETGERIFNHFGTGGYFVWNFPGEKNFIDSRNLNDTIFLKYSDLLKMYPGFEKKLDEYGIDYAIYLAPDLVRAPEEMKTTIISYFCTNPNWKLLFWDDKSFLWVRNLPKFQDLIDKYEYKYFNQYTTAFRKDIIEKGLKDDKAKLIKEFNRKLQEEPNGVVLNTFKMTYQNRLLIN